MKLKLPKEYWNNWGPPPLISYKANATIGKTLMDKLEYLKVNINTQPGERDSETVDIYVPMFHTGSPEALIKFINLLHKIIRSKELSTVPQNFGMTRNLVIGEPLQVFEQKSKERGTEKTQMMS